MKVTVPDYLLLRDVKTNVTLITASSSDERSAEHSAFIDTEISESVGTLHEITILIYDRMLFKLIFQAPANHHTCCHPFARSGSVILRVCV